MDSWQQGSLLYCDNKTDQYSAQAGSAIEVDEVAVEAGLEIEVVEVVVEAHREGEVHHEVAGNLA